MAPEAIVDRALELGFSIIGITDHNSTRQCGIVHEIGREKGLTVLCGVELTTREEVHLLAWFESPAVAMAFQGWIDNHLQKVPNNPDFFGHQVVVDRQEQVVYEEPNLLITALDTDVLESASAVQAFGGIAACAHLDKRKNSLFSQLGMMPKGLMLNAAEVASPASAKKVLGQLGERALPLLCGSDAHVIEDLGKGETHFDLHAPTFQEVRLALLGIEGRKVRI